MKLLDILLVAILNWFFKIPGSDTIFWHMFGKRFVAGETIEKSLEKMNKLKQRNFRITLAYAGERAQKKEDVFRAVLIHERLIGVASASSYEYEIALKPSAFMLPSGGVYPDFISGVSLPEEKRRQYFFARENIKRVVKKAVQNNMFVWIDAENFDMRGSTAELIIDLICGYKFKNIGLAMQSCFNDCALFYRETLLREISSKTGGKFHLPAIRICKGSCYNQKHELISNKKHEIAAGFFRLLEKAFSVPVNLRPGKIQVATHDKNLVKKVESEYLPAYGNFFFNKDRLEYGALLGRHKTKIVKTLRKKGRPVNVYALIGPRKKCREYLLRRIVENKKYFLYAFIK